MFFRTHRRGMTMTDRIVTVGGLNRLERKQVGRLRASGEGATPSPAIRKYMDRKIDSDEYFREVRRETEREVERELKEPTRTEDDGSE
jgi:hypothetical protein